MCDLSLLCFTCFVHMCVCVCCASCLCSVFSLACGPKFSFLLSFLVEQQRLTSVSVVNIMYQYKCVCVARVFS